MSFRRLSRRALLRGAGGAALALPFLDAMRPARADETVAPKRIVFVVTPNGMPMAHWKCAIAGTEASSFVLSPALAPLEDIRQDVLLVEGIGYESSYDPQGNAGAHEAGNTSMWTGTWAGPGGQFGGDGKFAGWAVSESIDAALATSIGGATKFPAYYLGLLPSLGSISTRMFYAAKDQPITPIIDPQSVWDSMFSELTADQATQAALRAKRKRTLDLVAVEARSLRCSLDVDDRARLDAHLAQVEELESRLDAEVSATCHPQPIGAVPNVAEFANLEELGRLHMDQLAMMLACDLTRVVGLQWLTPGNDGAYQWVGISEGHHTLTHQNTSESNQKLSQIGAFYASQIRYLVQKLRATPDVDGRTVMDNTVIVWAAECGDPWFHDRHDVPVAILGSGQGYFKTGKYIKLPERTPHNRLLLNLFECMGDPRSSFGAESYCAGGPIASLRA
jgi:hypothetical protein